MNRNQEYLDFAEDLAEQAGKIMLQYFDADDIGTIAKEDDSPLTIADTKINQLVIDAVKETYPDHGVLGEEDSFGADREYVWVCDPIDGTFPYAHGMPLSTFSIALVKNGDSLVGLLFDPFMNRIGTAIKGEGAWLNGKKLELQDSYPDTGWLAANIEVWGGASSSLFADPAIGNEARIALRGDDLFQLYLGSIAISGLLLAAGKVSAIVLTGNKPWDIAALSLLISEAGGVVSDCFGERDLRSMSAIPTRGIIAARNEAEYERITKNLLPLFEAAELR